MSPKKQSELTRNLEDLAIIAGHGRKTELQTMAPDWEKNVGRVRSFWSSFGLPALRDFQVAIDKYSPDFDNAARIDFDGMRRTPCPEWRIAELQAHVFQTRNFISAALQQLSRIPQRIDSIRPEDEQPWIVNNKMSDQITFEIRGVLNAGGDLKERHERLKHQLSQLSQWLRPSMLQPAAAEGVGDVN
jgi:hypothetical protein